VLYVTSGDSTIALDAATCALRWRHEANANGSPQRVGNAFKSGGVALQEGKLVRATSDGRLVALDAASGKLLWSQQVAGAGQYEFVTMAPLVFEDLAIVGIGIGEYGVRGWVGAFRLADGAPAWRFATVPDDGEPGAETWSESDARRRGGGGVWNTPSLDTDTGLLYVAVGNPVPDFFGDVRQGANLYTNTMLVLDVHTGLLKGYHQFVPHDLHDWDLTAVSPLYGTTAAEPRKLVAVAGKDGLLRSFDRETRAQVFAVPVTTRSNADAAPTPTGVHACPGVLGGMQWSPPAIQPALNLLYTAAVDWCGVFRKADDLRYLRGQLYLGGAFSFDPLEQARGWLSAVDASTGAVRWRYESAKPMLAAVTTTASELVFTGELSGHFLVLDGRNGTVLFRHDTQAPLHAGIVTYAVGGKQYVAVASGVVTSFWRVPAETSKVTVFGLP
jgi:alcohol dehydrogenase (cytochrome c)